MIEGAWQKSGLSVAWEDSSTRDSILAKADDLHANNQLWVTLGWNEVPDVPAVSAASPQIKAVLSNLQGVRLPFVLAGFEILISTGLSKSATDRVVAAQTSDGAQPMPDDEELPDPEDIFQEDQDHDDDQQQGEWETHPPVLAPVVFTRVGRKSNPSSKIIEQRQQKLASEDDSDEREQPARSQAAMVKKRKAAGGGGKSADDGGGKKRKTVVSQRQQKK